MEGVAGFVKVGAEAVCVCPLSAGGVDTATSPLTVSGACGAAAGARAGACDVRAEAAAKAAANAPAQRMSMSASGPRRPFRDPERMGRAVKPPRITETGLLIACPLRRAKSSANPEPPAR